MSNNVLANMAIMLSANTQQFQSGIAKAQASLTKFEGSASSLKGVDLSSLKVAFDRQVNSLASLQKAAREYGRALRHATDEKEIKALNQALEQTQAEMQRIRSLGKQGLTGIGAGANSAAGGMDKLKGSAGQVNMEFARIIQDAPFGMMGIGNNIQQLTANFGQLRAQAGSTGSAVKAALSSMITPASLLTLGVAALTSAWVVYEKWQQKSAKGAAENAKGLRSAKNATDEYIKSLNSVTQARLNGEREAQKELTTLRLLYKQTQDTSVSIRDRKKAVDELQKQYPAYFGNLKDEDILAGKAAASYQKLTSSIIATAKARAAQELITDKAREQLVNEQKINDLKGEQAKVEATRIKQAATLAKVQEKLRQNGDNSQANAQALLRAKTEGEITSLKKEQNNLIKENARLTKEMLALEPTASLDLSTDSGIGSTAKTKEAKNALKELEIGFNQATKEAIVFGDSFDEMGTKAGLFRTAINTLLEQGLKPQSSVIQNLKSTFDLFSGTTLPQATGAIDRFTKQDFSGLNEGLAETAAAINVVGVELTNLPAAVLPAQGALAIFFEDLKSHVASLGSISEQISNFALNMIDSFSGAMSSIAEGIGAGAIGLENFGKSLLAALADLGRQVGQFFVKMGLPMLLSGNPVGAALMAAGLALSAFSGTIGASASGGGVAPNVSGAGNFTQSNYQRPERNGPTEIYTKISGRDLLLILKNESAFSTRFGGANS